MPDRSNLPFREKAEAILIYDGKIVAIDKGRYVQFGGGGVDPGESAEKAVRREIKEEIGCTVDRLQCVASIDAVWWPEWTEGKEKRLQRYEEFQGERSHIFIGFVDKLGKPTSTEGDAWEGGVDGNLMPLDKIIKISEEGIENAHSNFKCYHEVQLTVLKSIKYFKEALKPTKNSDGGNKKGKIKRR
tara:strand:+ start:2125 stop:2685 length:561 start_codon:yes stop_codon:yes gene_type:complete